MLTVLQRRSKFPSLQVAKSAFNSKSVRILWLTQQWKSGILRGVDWYLFTDVTGQPIGSIFKGQAVREEKRVLFGLLEDVTGQFGSKCRYRTIPIYDAQYIRRAEIAFKFYLTCILCIKMLDITHSV
jgi:hypothetical protein